MKYAVQVPFPVDGDPDSFVYLTETVGSWKTKDYDIVVRQFSSMEEALEYATAWPKYKIVEYKENY